MKIPLKHIASGRKVADVTFKGGGELGATGHVVKTGEGTNNDVKIIRDAILKYKNFSLEQVYTPKGHVAIWRGFWGWLCGIRLILPTIGYEMVTADIDWP
ncbi:MAG: hypothetical protein GY841_15325 [FCB group bacterium]|nr:hypothetical protein [FCB group bacterium]